MTRASDAVRVRYLDASALVMLLVDEGDCAHLREFYNANTNFQTTTVCLIEALGVLKRKRRNTENGLTPDEYYRLSRELLAEGRPRIYPTEPELVADLFVQLAVEELARKHNLDLVDALQLLTLQRGPFSHFCGDSAPVLITGDKKLAKAAIDEGIRVWNCRKGPAPEWA